jgi:hypothetical protein
LEAGDHVIAVLVHHIGVENASVMTGQPGLLAEVQAGTDCFGTDAQWKCLQADAWRQDLPCLMSHFGFWEECNLAHLPEDWFGLKFPDADWPSASLIEDPVIQNLVERDIPMLPREPVPITAVVGGGTFQKGEVPEDTDAKRNSGAGGWQEGASSLGIPAKQVLARVRHAQPGNGTLPLELNLTPESGCWFTVDFGTTVSGYPVLKVVCESEDIRMDISYDDTADEAGVVNPERSYARMSDRYRLRKGINRIQPMNPRGFRFLMIDLFGEGSVRVEQISGISELYPFHTSGQFTSSDHVLNRLLTVADQTLRICTPDAFLDCSTRERVQWMQDIYLHAKTAAYLFGDTTMLRRTLYQAAQNALPDGRINGFMPSERTGCAFASSSLVWLHLMVDYLLFSGDEEGLKPLLPTLGRLLAMIDTQTGKEGLMEGWPSGQFWDWAPIEDGGCCLVTNAFYVWGLERLSEHSFFSAVLPDNVRERIDQIRKGAHQRFWDAGRKLYRDRLESTPPVFSQHANSLAVLSKICPESERESLLRNITDSDQLGPVPVGEAAIWAVGHPGSENVVQVGTLWFSFFICQALFENGMATEALEQLQQLWGPFAEGPTFPETRISHGNTTQCHGWAAGPGVLLPAYILGVQPLAAGWSKVRIFPQCGGLDSAEGAVPTPFGEIKVSWHREGDQLRVSHEAPPGIEVV